MFELRSLILRRQRQQRVKRLRLPLCTVAIQNRVDLVVARDYWTRRDALDITQVAKYLVVECVREILALDDAVLANVGGLPAEDVRFCPSTC
jgi:hypothetical protein